MSYDDYRYMQYPQGTMQGDPNVQQYYAQYYGYPQMQQPWTTGWFDFKNPSYLKGLVIAAGVTLLITNPKVQKGLLTGMAKAWSGLQYGMEEVKEQINDIKAEMQFNREQKAAGDGEDA